MAALAFAFVSWLSPAAPCLAGDGFGVLNKDSAYLVRAHPPKVFLGGTRIAVRATAQQPELAPAAERLRSLLESEILSADPRLALDPSRPETAVEVTLVESEGSERWETRTVLKQRKTGEDSKGKAIYTQYEDTVRYKIVTYRFAIAYKVLDTRTRTSLDADTITRRFEEDFAEGTGAPDLSSLESSMMSQAIEVIKLRITPSREQIGVLIPRGSLKDFANLAAAGLWNQYLEAIEGLPQRPKPADEAYRQYAIGLAYEALAYAPDNATDDTLRHLQQASVYYNQALQMNPAEKYFSLPYERSLFNPAALLGRLSANAPASSTYPAPLDRVRSALVDYQRIKEFDGSSRSAEGAKSASASDASSATDALDNADVIEMVKAGLPEDIILTAIDTASATRFDVSPKGLIELAKAKVSQRLIERLQTRPAGP